MTRSELLHYYGFKRIPDTNMYQKTHELINCEGEEKTPIIIIEQIYIGYRNHLDSFYNLKIDGFVNCNEDIYLIKKYLDKLRTDYFDIMEEKDN